MSISGLSTYIKNPLSVIMPLERRGWLKWMPDPVFMRIAFKSEMGYSLNLKKPRTYSEKIQWSKLYDRKKIYNTFVDKYAVRQYVAETIGDEYLIPLIGLYDSVEEIEWDILPDQFVLKCTHGSKSNIICTDKSNLDIMDATAKLDGWLNRNWFWFGREWAYKDVQPRIICEKYIPGKNAMTPDDFKVKCFNGKAAIIDIHHDRFGDHTMNTYDCDWNELSYNANIKMLDTPFPKPACFDDMIEKSSLLAKDTYVSRIDWYYIDSKLYFGEITLYEASGYVKKGRYDIDLLYGRMIHLPTDNNEGEKHATD